MPRPNPSALPPTRAAARHPPHAAPCFSLCGDVCCVSAPLLGCIAPHFFLFHATLWPTRCTGTRVCRCKPGTPLNGIDFARDCSAEAPRNQTLGVCPVRGNLGEEQAGGAKSAAGAARAVKGANGAFAWRALLGHATRIKLRFGEGRAAGRRDEGGAARALLKTGTQLNLLRHCSHGKMGPGHARSRTVGWGGVLMHHRPCWISVTQVCAAQREGSETEESASGAEGGWWHR